MAPLDGAGATRATLDMGNTTLPDDVAYSLLEVKSVNEQSRKIRGLATTPSTDRMGDIVDPMGVKFKNPMPLLWMHKSDKPVGQATFSKPTSKGIEFEATIPNVVEPGVLKDRVDEAWQSIQHNLVKGVSIGFRPIEYSFIDDGGVRFIETEVMELSLVTIPANSDCTLSLVKSIDAETRAAKGNARPADPQPGATGKPTPTQRATKLAKKTYGEQITAMEATRAAKAARIEEIQDGAIEEGRTKSEQEREEFETLERDIGGIDKELVDLRRLETMNLQTVKAIDGTDPAKASQSRQGTIIGRIPGLRRVPFKIKIPRQTGAATVGWVGEGKIKPLSQLAFDTVTLEIAKIAGIIVLTDELVRESSPAAEGLVRDELAAAVVQYMDSQFVDPTKASNDVSPASVTYGVTPVTATGTTASALRQDVRTLMATFLSTNSQLGSAVWIMTQETALGISLMMNTLGQPEFPGISMQGGTFLGIPVITSEGVPATGGSPTDGFPIILVNAGDILLADDGQVTIDASREASLQMDSAPDSPETASTVMVSMWQHNMMAVKAERYINWTKRRSTAVGFIQNAKYAE
jgi:HK97 family phage prohead protease